MEAQVRPGAQAAHPVCKRFGSFCLRGLYTTGLCHLLFNTRLLQPETIQ